MCERRGIPAFRFGTRRNFLPLISYTIGNTTINMRLATPLVLAILLLATPGALIAQYSGFGIKAGPQANIYRATNIRTIPTPGMTMGVYIPFSAAPRLEVQPEILITILGSGLIEPDGDRMTMRTTYIQAPVSAKYYLGNEFNLQFGVQLARLITAQRIDASGTTDVRERYRGFDSGFNLGAGLDMVSGLDFTLRYYSGMPVLLVGDDALFPRNRSLQVTIGKRLIQMRRFNTSRRRS
jgi:hypothetical protein